MNEHARKPDEAPTSVSQRVGKVADALPVDDPSIPVLTERLTLPPLDLDLEFRLPPAPSAGTPAESQASSVPPLETSPDALREAPIEAPSEPALETVIGPQLDAATLPAGGGLPDALGAEEAPPIPPLEEPISEMRADEPAVRSGAATVGSADLEPTLLAPRVPTSLLAANVLAREMPPSPALREDELTGSEAWGPRRMETDLREMILLDLARRLPTEVESIVRRYLEGAIDQAMARFAAEARIALAATLREMVDRAVKAELERLKAQTRR